MQKIAVITISDRAARGEYSDRSGPAIALILQEKLTGCRLARAVVPDDREAIRLALEAHLDCDWILTTGGTGISPRDMTPEATREFCEREVPGIAEWLRRESENETPHAVFSRGFCGIKGQTIIVNLPGSVQGASFCAALLVTVMEHGTKMLAGGGH